ncbi:MAG: hypothetical protein GTO55_01180 [Armatimonadetes bacterium]|nr:hypothetical protein [Armatimonadota bacterium]NIM22894.1 hypothetical protein [Armatimonadota bacterium]NIM66761.1 hypothetical protein [Armatimonadota bacterium]NIM75308.1 hypothetical protein [Armatimonadota bacterium]NIN04957.1 hypothetical protein [Armatimonadota bacterium]
MPTAYTPGLRITEDTIVERERRLPIKGEVLVEAGAVVEPETVVARCLLEGDIHSFKAAEQLGISSSELSGLLKKRVGDKVEKGELLAEVKGFFGLFRSECRAPVAGTIEHIGTTSGYIGIRQSPRPIEVLAYLRGEVAEVLPEEGVMMKARAAFIQGIFGVGGERYGRMKMACDRPDESLTEDHLSEEMRGAIIVCGSGASSAALEEAARIGVAGLIVGALSDEQLRGFVGYDIGVAITGQEQVPFTLILTEGFGEIPMAERTFRILQSLEGKAASINGATQIRAGVIRPEIIIPREAVDAAGEEGSLTGAVADKAGSTELAPGVKVRMIREPYFGGLGEVTALPAELQTVETGAKVRVAVIQTEDGQEITVPRANLEIIQE